MLLKDIAFCPLFYKRNEVCSQAKPSFCQVFATKDKSLQVPANDSFLFFSLTLQFILFQVFKPSP